MIETLNPATGEVLERYAPDDADALEGKIATAWSRWRGDWRTRPLEDRLDVLERAAKVLDARRDELAALVTSEMGKPIAASRAEVDKCAWLCRDAAGRTASYLEPDVVDVGGDAERAYVRYDPLGPILAVMPWNFPLWQVFRFAVPAVACGNVGLLKHAANVTGCALAIEDVLREAGLPDGAFTTLLIGHDAVGALIADRRIRAVTITGSDAAGRAVASAAGRHLKRSVLELGGSDPFLVLDDADVASAAKTAADSRYLNSGQSCINAKRLIVDRAVYGDFLDALVAEVDALRVGDPLDEATQLGPIARHDLRDQVHDQVRRTIDAGGGALLRGGDALDGPGAFYAPTILRDVDPGAPAAIEEVFGPVAAVFEVDGEDEAVALANDSRYGLGAAVMTSDLERGERLATRIESGMVFLNELVKSDPRLPFGGVKDSGYGRELARWGFREFLNTKAVWVAAAASSSAPGASE